MDRLKPMKAILTQGQYQSSYKVGDEITFQYYQKTPQNLIAQNDYALPYGFLSEEATIHVRTMMKDEWQPVGIVTSVKKDHCEIDIHFSKPKEKL